MEKITISRELCDYIEALHYEVNALQDLLNHASSEENAEILEKYWYDKYIEKYTEYVLAKQELENEYVVPKFGNEHKWHLNFNDAILEVQ